MTFISRIKKATAAFTVTNNDDPEFVDFDAQET